MEAKDLREEFNKDYKTTGYIPSPGNQKAIKYRAFLEYRVIKLTQEYAEKTKRLNSLIGPFAILLNGVKLQFGETGDDPISPNEMRERWDNAGSALEAATTQANPNLSIDMEPGGIAEHHAEHLEITEPKYKNAVCKGSWKFNNNCGTCEKCITTKALQDIKEPLFYSVKPIYEPKQTYKVEHVFGHGWVVRFSQAINGRYFLECGTRSEAEAFLKGLTYNEQTPAP